MEKGVGEDIRKTLLINMMVNMRLIRKTGKVLLLGLLVTFIEGLIRMTNEKVMVRCFGLMDLLM
jgi:hypothetical protein